VNLDYDEMDFESRDEIDAADRAAALELLVDGGEL
jgi:hypothetical protein